jgi:integral membrane sensor domain MASE1
MGEFVPAFLIVGLWLAVNWDQKPRRLFMAGVFVAPFIYTVIGSVLLAFIGWWSGEPSFQ